MTNTIFNPINLGDLVLKNRIVLPPMTRSRANNDEQAATALMAEYYAQRASAGLLITEGTQISPMAKGYAWTPGIYTAEQIKGWKQVTHKVHEKNGVIYAQLWHVGRVTHPDSINGEQPIAPSAIKAEGVKVFVDNGQAEPNFVEVVMPREMTGVDIIKVIQQYQQAALNAIEAGFDGVELHAANGYLINQFIDSGSNQRHDLYGGSIENRLRFLDDIVTVVSKAIGANKVGVRLAPLTTLNGTVDETPEETYVEAAKLLNRHQIAYIHIAEADWDDAPQMSQAFKEDLRAVFNGVIIYAGKYSSEGAEMAIKSNVADMIAFGRPFIANPDLPERIKKGQAWAEPDSNTFFGGGREGYTDYTTL